MTVFEADWTWTGSKFETGIQIAVTESGRIEAVGQLQRAPTHRLAEQALLPGMINVHSHAFQRALRGRGETFPQGAGSFWTWREAMYQLVEALDADAFYRWSRQAFDEMLACGITTVGEFHYDRHDDSCEGYAFDEVILEAALHSGIRLVLLPAYYNTGGVGKPLNGGQKRFGCPSPNHYWRQFDRLATLLKNDTQSMGAVVHSIRAANLDDLVSIQRESRKRGLVFHIHVEEQRQEISDCVATYGKTPMGLILENLDVDPNFTAIHCTHTDPRELQEFSQAGGNVGLCPLSEANLGDGIANVPGIRGAGGTICIGTDSNARLCMMEEMRWIEYVQRLKGEKRGVCLDDSGNCAHALWEMATLSGARSLGLNAGQIERGSLADFTTFNLNAPALKGWSPDSLLDAIVLGTAEDVVTHTIVGGIPRFERRIR